MHQQLLSIGTPFSARKPFQGGLPPSLEVFHHPGTLTAPFLHPNYSYRVIGMSKVDDGSTVFDVQMIQYPTITMGFTLSYIDGEYITCDHRGESWLVEITPHFD